MDKKQADYIFGPVENELRQTQKNKRRINAIRTDDGYAELFPILVTVVWLIMIGIMIFRPILHPDIRRLIDKVPAIIYNIGTFVFGFFIGSLVYKKYFRK